MEQPLDDSVGGPGDVGGDVGALIEKSLRGALSADEQVRLGRLLTEDPGLAARLARARAEDEAMQAAAERVVEGFDFERAGRAIRNRIRWQRGLLIAGAGIVALWAPAWALAHRARTGAWPGAGGAGWGLTAASVVLAGALYLWVVVGPRWRLERELAAGGDVLRRAYEREVRAIPRRVMLLRAAAVLAGVGGVVLLAASIAGGHALSAAAAVVVLGASGVCWRESSRLPGVLSGREALPGSDREGAR